MRMNIGALGNEGVGAVNSYFNRMGYVKTYINSDDTTPVWDGSLFIYSDRTKFTNERLIFVVPLQVKSHEYDSDEFPDTTKFDIEIVNLHNYLIDGGVAFFNVLVGIERCQVYVNFLTKASIKNYLSTAKGEKTRSVPFSKVPRTYTELVSKLRTLHLQRTHNLIPYEEAKKYENVQWAIDSYGLKSGDNELEYITSHPVNILAYIDGVSEPLYVGETAARISSISLPENSEIRVGDTVYFNSLKRTVECTSHTLSLGKSLTIRFESEEKRAAIHVKAELHGTSLDEVIHEAKFVFSFLEHKEISINGHLLKLDIDVKPHQIKEWKRIVKFWKEVKDLFNLLHIEEPIQNILDLSDEELKRIETLIAGLLYNRTVIGTNGYKIDHLEWVSFSNIRVMVFARYLSGNKYKLVNVFDSLSAYYMDNDGNYKTASVYSKVIAEEILASNIDWTNLLKSYQNAIQDNPDFYERANWDVLWLIKWYDKTNRISILNAADELLCWIVETDKKTSWHNEWTYNSLQIKQRKAISLSEEDKEWLPDQEDLLTNNQSLEDFQKKQMLFAIQVLLLDALKAKRLYSKLNADEQEFIKCLPIYTLYENLISRENG